MSEVDELLARRLDAALAAAEGPGPDQERVAKGLFAWRAAAGDGVETFLAELVFDSAVDAVDGEVMALSAARTVGFLVGATEIQLLADSSGMVTCVVEPSDDVSTVSLRHGGGEETNPLGIGGRTTFADVPKGFVRLTLHTNEGRIATPAVRL